jgi:hypothetical protein
VTAFTEENESYIYHQKQCDVYHNITSVSLTLASPGLCRPHHSVKEVDGIVRS